RPTSAGATEVGRLPLHQNASRSNKVKRPGVAPTFGDPVMLRFANRPHLWLLTLLAAALAAAPAHAQPPKDLDAKLRQLEKQIAEVRGLAFKTPVDAKIIPRPQGKDRSLQGYYSPREKRLYLYDDLTGNYERGVLIHEMVHALQDQHFGLE